MRGITDFTQRSAELLNLKNSLFLSRDGLWETSASEEFDLETTEEWGMEEGNCVKCGVFGSYTPVPAILQHQPRCWGLAGEETVVLSAGCVCTNTHTF